MFRSLFLALLIPSAALAHDGLDLPPPSNDAEAWNALQLCLSNVDKLVVEEQWGEIPIQLAIVGQSARYFRDKTQGDVSAKWTELEQTGIFAIRAALEKDRGQTKRFYQTYRGLVGELEKVSDAKLVRSTVYSCPMCRGIRELDPKKECFKCGMALVPRVVPASSVYNTPGEPSVIITPKTEKPLVVGESAKVRVQFTRKKDQRPVIVDDLLIVHT
ncbi:MAG TPA: hypothetical protein VFG14_09785, partial [Chthoniobacteraceae bacterium]|nr:hypothetical protein [Chthoniobacteraceae bacterium]